MWQGLIFLGKNIVMFSGPLCQNGAGGIALLSCLLLRYIWENLPLEFSEPCSSHARERFRTMYYIYICQEHKYVSHYHR